MSSQKLNPIYKKENLRQLRRYLNMTQREFICRFLSDGEGTPSMSPATYSNLESKGGRRLDEVILSAAAALNMDSMLFSMKPEEFVRKMDIVLAGTEAAERMSRNAAKKGRIDELLFRLTMYFAEKLMDKELKKGDQIESDRVLAKKMNVGRSSIREALKVLDVLGMIDIRPGQGTYISSAEADFFIIPLSWSLFLNGSQVEDILTVRNLLEVKAAELAAGSAKSAGIRKLEEISELIRRAYEDQNQKEFLEYDIEFHTCIAECSGSRVILSMIQTISNLMRHISGTGMADEAQLKAIYEEHRNVYRFILAHDSSGAAKAMGEHLEQSVTRYNYR